MGEKMYRKDNGPSVKKPTWFKEKCPRITIFQPNSAVLDEASYFILASFSW